MSELQQNLELINQEKAQKIKPENIKEGLKIFNVTGTLRQGTDTSDATAKASDIIEGKVAYSQGQRLVGICKNSSRNVIFSIEMGDDGMLYAVSNVDDILTSPYAIDDNGDFIVKIEEDDNSTYSMVDNNLEVVF